MYSLSKKARHGVDRTKYTSRRHVSFITHHTQRMSLSVVKAEGSALHQAIGLSKADLDRLRRA